MTHKVLLIGWDAADWKVITPLLDAGKMPHLEKFVSQGVMGNLATLSPVLFAVQGREIGLSQQRQSSVHRPRFLRFESMDKVWRWNDNVFDIANTPIVA